MYEFIISRFGDDLSYQAGFERHFPDFRAFYLYCLHTVWLFVVHSLGSGRGYLNSQLNGKMCIFGFLVPICSFIYNQASRADSKIIVKLRYYLQGMKCSLSAVKEFLESDKGQIYIAQGIFLQSFLSRKGWSFTSKFLDSSEIEGYKYYCGVFSGEIFSSHFEGVAASIWFHFVFGFENSSYDSRDYTFDSYSLNEWKNLVQAICEYLGYQRSLNISAHFGNSMFKIPKFLFGYIQSLLQIANDICTFDLKELASSLTGSTIRIIYRMTDTTNIILQEIILFLPNGRGFVLQSDGSKPKPLHPSHTIEAKSLIDFFPPYIDYCSVAEFTNSFLPSLELILGSNSFTPFTPSNVQSDSTPLAITSGDTSSPADDSSSADHSASSNDSS